MTNEIREIVDSMRQQAVDALNQSKKHKHTQREGTQAKCICKTEGECKAKMHKAKTKSSVLRRKANQIESKYLED